MSFSNEPLMAASESRILAELLQGAQIYESKSWSEILHRARKTGLENDQAMAAFGRWMRRLFES